MGKGRLNIAMPDWFYSVRTKLTLVTSVLILAISAFIYWYFPDKLERQSVTAVAQKANTVVGMMAFNIAPTIVFDDRPLMRDIVMSVRQIQDLDYVVVVNEAGNVIASYDSVRASATNYTAADFAERTSEDGKTYQTVAPIVSSGKFLGRVYLGLSLTPVQAEIRASKQTIAWVSLFVSAFGILFVIALSALVTTPLRRMALVVERLSRGDWSQRAVVSTRDELGQLGRAFNAMVNNLEGAYDDLSKSEKNYRDLFGANPHPMWVFDIDTLKFLEVNDSAVESYGYSREEFLAMTLHDIILDNANEKMELLHSRAGNLYRSTGWRHLKRDGSIIDVEMSAHSLPMSAGRKSRLVLASDITKRLRAEALLRESEERYRDLFESASDLIISIGADCRLQFVNRAWMDSLGFSEQEIPELHFFDLVKKDELPRFKVAFRDAINGKRLEHFQTVLVGKEGREVVVEGSLSSKFEGGEAVSTRGIFRDITERKRSEAAILLQKTRFEQLFENAPIGIVLADKTGRVVQANKVFLSMFRYSLDEVVGNSIDDLIVPQELKAESDSLSLRIQGGESIRTETTRNNKVGNPIDVGLYGVPIRVNGNSLGLFGMYVDITQRKQAEQRQAELMAELENINKELNDFAYIVSHDLKAPLRGIGSLVDWLMSDYAEKLGDDGNQLLKVLLGRTKRMHDLIDGVLKYSRIGRTKEEASTVELDKLVPEVADFLAPPSHIEVKIQRPLPIIKGETTRVQQVFQNLMSNAIKFIDKPNGRIEVGCVRENGHWKFSVADNGPGIEERHFTKIFQIFQTLSARDEYESTGIGLTIVKKIVETYGGKIWLESKVGKGTTFYFTVPVHRNN